MDKLQWGNRKRLRCVKVKAAADHNNSPSPPTSFVHTASRKHGDGGTVVLVKKKITSPYADISNNASIPPLPSPYQINRDIGPSSESQKVYSAVSPEKGDRYYTTRGSSSVVGFDDHSKMLFCGDARDDNKKLVWPKLVITLSRKEKEEDFMVMKGCKPPQRPKKRAKSIQKTLLLVSPGTWLSDLCQERYEVREKTTSKKKPRGLKAMGSMESDSE